MAEGGIIPMLDGEKPTGPPMSPIAAIAALKVRAASGTLPNPGLVPACGLPTPATCARARCWERPLPHPTHSCPGFDALEPFQGAQPPAQHPGGEEGVVPGQRTTGPLACALTRACVGGYIAARQPHTKQCLWTMAGVGATMGIHLGDMAGALLFMKDSLHLSFEEQEIVMGALYLSTGLAALCLGYAPR